MAFCTNCGNNIGDDKFCTQCGVPASLLDEVAAEQTSQPPQVNQDIEPQACQASPSMDSMVGQTGGFEAPTTIFSEPVEDQSTVVPPVFECNVPQEQASQFAASSHAPQSPSMDSVFEGSLDNKYPQYDQNAMAQVAPMDIPGAQMQPSSMAMPDTVSQTLPVSKPEPEPKKKSKLGVIIGIIVAVLLIAAVVVVFFVLKPFEAKNVGTKVDNPPVTQNGGGTEPVITDDPIEPVDTVENEGLIALKDAKVGDVVHFGKITYNTHKVVDGKAIEEERTVDIGWRVLEIKDGKALVISEATIGAEPFQNNDTATSWEDSSIRVWLNDDFYDALPTDVKENIVETDIQNIDNADTQDSVFLLDISEAEKYFSDSSDRIAAPAKCLWWLRSSGSDTNLIVVVNGNGDILEKGRVVNRADVYVRPAFYITIPD